MLEASCGCYRAACPVQVLIRRGHMPCQQTGRKHGPEIWLPFAQFPLRIVHTEIAGEGGEPGICPVDGYQIIGDENPLTVCSPASLPRTERLCPLRWEKYMTVVFITGRLCEKDASTTSRQGRQGVSITEHQRRTGQRRREEIVTSSHLHHAKSRPPSDVVVLADPTPSATTDLARGRHARNHSRDLHHHPGRGGGDGGHSLTSRRRAREENRTAAALGLMLVIASSRSRQGASNARDSPAAAETRCRPCPNQSTVRRQWHAKTAPATHSAAGDAIGRPRVFLRGTVAPATVGHLLWTPLV